MTTRYPVTTAGDVAFLLERERQVGGLFRDHERHEQAGYSDGLA